MVAAITSLFLCLAVQRFRLRAVAQYDGRRFHGVQKNVRTQDGAPLRTVLLTLEQALWPALGRQVKIGVAGRTDAGVSAEGQVIIFDADTLDGEAACVSVDGSAVRVPDLAGALNAHLPADLQLKRVDVVPSRFDVVRCRWKRYRYRLPSTRCLPGRAETARHDDSIVNPFPQADCHTTNREKRSGACSSWWRRTQPGPRGSGARKGSTRSRRGCRRLAPGSSGGAKPRNSRCISPTSARCRRRRACCAAPVDPHIPAFQLALDASRARLRFLSTLTSSSSCSFSCGTHDFAAFQSSGGDQRSTTRTVYRCVVEPRCGELVGGSGEAEVAYDVVVEGDGFLYRMVRIIAGTLLMVGMGFAPAETVLTALAADAGSDGGRCGGGGGGGHCPKAEMRMRGIVGPVLPPEGLCLEHIEYDREHSSVSGARRREL